MLHKSITITFIIIFALSFGFIGCGDDDSPSGTSNEAPATPSAPVPADDAIDQSTDVDLSWECSDPDGDQLTYDVYFGDSDTPPSVQTAITTKSYDPGALENDQTYYWKIVAKDEHDHSTESPIWSFTTNANSDSPNPPSSPSPSDGATNQWIIVNLSWECSNPDDDTLTYDIYFGTTDNPALASDDYWITNANPGLLDYSQTYYWKIVVKDNHGNSTSGPVWSFTTEADDGDNNTFNTADWIEFSVDKVEKIEIEGDVDYYKVNVEAPGVIDVKVDPVPAEIDLEIQIFDSNQDDVAYAGGNNGQPVTAAYLATPGLYYIEIRDRYSNAASDDTYTMNVLLDERDVHEVNNSFNDAKVIPLNADYECEIRPEGDTDFFKVDLPQPGVLCIDVDFVPDDVDLEVNIYDSEQNDIAYSSGNNGQPVYCYALRSAETCYFKFNDRYGNGSSREFYTFSLTLDTSDVYEVNNTFNQAKEVMLGDVIQAKIRPEGDVDLFKVFLPRDGVLELVIDPVPSELDIELKLFDSNQQDVEYSGGSAGEPVSMYEIMPAGNCYFQINDRYGNAMSTEFYNCSVNLDTSDTYEINNTFSNAKEIALDTDIYGKIRPDEDVDYFKFTVPETGPLNVNVTNVPEGVSMIATVYNSSQQDLETEVSDGSVINLAIEAVNVGDYYLLLDAYYSQNSPDAYTLRVSQ